VRQFLEKSMKHNTSEYLTVSPEERYVDLTIPFPFFEQVVLQELVDSYQ
jgi:hypothetical protein